MQAVASSLLGGVIVLGFLIFAHESGHFLVAKLFKVRVLVFSLGFGKRLAGFRRGGTDYRLSLIPLGGYVRMAGDTPEENQPSNPDEFLSKPKWQRFLILVAGPLMNLVIAVTFLAGINMYGYREPYSPNVIDYLEPGKPGEKAGLRTGDRIVEIGGETIREWEDLRLTISINAGTALRVVYMRDGKLHETILTPLKEEGKYGPVGYAGIAAPFPPVIVKILPDTASARAGLKKGDRFVMVNGRPITRNMTEVVLALTGAKTKIPIEVLRGGTRVRLTMEPPPKRDSEQRYPGFAGPYETRFVQHSLIPALGASVNENLRMLRAAMSAIRRMFRPE